MFFFNFGGYSGKFYFRDDRTPVLVPEADFKIEPITINTAENIIGFIIRSRCQTFRTKFFKKAYCF